MRRRLASIAASAQRARGCARARVGAHALDVRAFSMWTLDRGDRQSRQPLELVADLRAQRGGDLCEVEPVLDDDVEVDP